MKTRNIDPLKAASGYSSYFDKLTAWFMNLRSDCLKYSEYQSIYSESTRLQAALCKYYATFIRFCQKVIQDNQKESKLNINVPGIVSYI